MYRMQLCVQPLRTVFSRLRRVQKQLRSSHNTRKITGVSNFEFNTATKLNSEKIRNEDLRKRHLINWIYFRSI